MGFRLSPRNLCMADAMPFQQHHEARVYGRDLSDLLTEELFLNVRNNLQPGDEVVICGYADQTAQRLTQFARLRIVSMSKDGVRFMQDGKTTDIPMGEGDIEPERPASPLEVVKQFGGGFNVIDKKSDSVLETFKTKKEAEEWASAYA